MVNRGKFEEIYAVEKQSDEDLEHAFWKIWVLALIWETENLHVEESWGEGDYIEGNNVKIGKTKMQKVFYTNLVSF